MFRRHGSCEQFTGGGTLGLYYGCSWRTLRIVHGVIVHPVDWFAAGLDPLFSEETLQGRNVPGGACVDHRQAQPNRFIGKASVRSHGAGKEEGLTEQKKQKGERVMSGC